MTETLRHLPWFMLGCWVQGFGGWIPMKASRPQTDLPELCTAPGALATLRRTSCKDLSSSSKTCRQEDGGFDGGFDAERMD